MKFDPILLHDYNNVYLAAGSLWRQGLHKEAETMTEAAAKIRERMLNKASKEATSDTSA